MIRRRQMAEMKAILSGSAIKYGHNDDNPIRQ